MILDEVHEQDKYTEFLLIVLRELIAKGRSDLRVILMSATMRATDFIAYFECPSISIGTSLFDVQEVFLEDILTETGYLIARDGKLVCDEEVEDDGIPTEEMNLLLSDLNDTNASETQMFTCEMCGASHFTSPEMLGEHIVMCDGTPPPPPPPTAPPPSVLDELFASVEAQPSSTSPQPSHQTASLLNEMFGTPAPSPLDELFSQDTGSSGSASQPVNMAAIRTIDEIESSTPSLPSANALLTQYYSTHLEEDVDYKIISSLVRHICLKESTSGQTAGCCILVFLPGWQEIVNMKDLLEQDHALTSSHRINVLTLHSGVPVQDQRKVSGLDVMIGVCDSSPRASIGLQNGAKEYFQNRFIDEYRRDLCHDR